MNEIKGLLFLIIMLLLLLSCNNSSNNNDPPQDSTTREETTRGNPPDNCIPNTDGRRLRMTLKPQEADFWCWAACAEMVMEHLEATITQCNEADSQFHRQDCCNSRTPDICNEGGWPEFEKFGFTAEHTINQELSWEEVKKQIACRKTPFCVTWRWLDGGPDTSGHMMVISGYKKENGENLVRLRDPYPVGGGASRWITYSAYVSKNSDDTSYAHWNDYFNISRIR